MICGHIHHATIRQIDALTYVNCGDWVESCPAVVDGRFEIVDWTRLRPAPAASPADA